MSKKQTCDTCRHGFKFDLKANPAQPAAMCRRYPPTVLEHNYDDSGLYYGCWPTVFLYNWCGEYQPED